jgi:hypothetical protein
MFFLKDATLDNADEDKERNPISGVRVDYTYFDMVGPLFLHYREILYQMQHLILELRSRPGQLEGCTDSLFSPSIAVSQR